MYRPKAFDIVDVAEIHALIESIVIGHVISASNGGLIASVVPLLLDRTRGELGTLVGHLARPNRQWSSSDPGIEAMVVFAGPDAYVSPNYYPSKHENPAQVPTWNYVTINAHGPLTVHDDKTWVAALVRRLTDRHEASRPLPWSLDDAPAAYVDSLVGAIVGIEIPITRLEGKAKLSQNRARQDIDGVTESLSAGTASERAVADLMRRQD